jgi:hypothetical protein
MEDCCDATKPIDERDGDQDSIARSSAHYSLL